MAVGVPIKLYQYNDRWVCPPRTPWPMAIQTQEQMKHSHLKNYTAAARATASRVLGRRLAWQWLVAAAGGAPAMSYGILAAHEMQWSTMSQLARVVELLL